MVNKLLDQGIKVQRAARDFTHEGRVYDAGSFVVSMAQPKRGVVRWLLGRTFYPDNSYTRDREGNPIRPYDMSTDTMSEFMGIRVDAVDSAVDTDLASVEATIEPAGRVAKGRFGYRLDGRLNDSFRAANRLIASGATVRRVDRDGVGGLQPGDFLVAPSATDSLVADLASELGVNFEALDVEASAASHVVGPVRIGMYQRYFGGNMDEGWTRWLLERFEFPYASVLDAEIVAGDLNASYDVIVLPADSVARMTGETTESTPGRTGADAYPPEYRSGFGQEGVDALQAFVRQGGTLVTFAQAGSLAIDKFGLPVRNVVAGVPSTEFWSPGSTLRVRVDSASTLAYGMPADALATFLAGNQAYEVVPTPRNERVERVVTFIDRDLLRSGWLLGEQVIAEKAAMVSVEHGQGRVVLIGFRAQHRAQTHGTFKLVFNALLLPRPVTADESPTAGQQP